MWKNKVKIKHLILWLVDHHFQVTIASVVLMTLRPRSHGIDCACDYFCIPDAIAMNGHLLHSLQCYSRNRIIWTLKLWTDRVVTSNCFHCRWWRSPWRLEKGKGGSILKHQGEWQMYSNGTLPLPLMDRLTLRLTLGVFIALHLIPCNPLVVTKKSRQWNFKS